MMRSLIAILFSLCVLLTLSAVLAAQPRIGDQIPVSEESQTCIDCHEMYNPGLVMDWRSSRHARTSPGQAMSKPKASRRISSPTIPDHLTSHSVGCYECHTLNTERHEDNFDHFGEQINIVVSRNDCATCHAVEAEQYGDSKKAHAIGNLKNNPVYDGLVETVLGVKTVEGNTVTSQKASHLTRGEACFNCHGTEVKVAGMKVVSIDMGDIEVPELTGWPNQGVGRINPDGSMGSCTACHPRHSFSIEIARKPYTCGQCHLEPDVPAYNIYKESKHGNIFESKKESWPWHISRFFPAYKMTNVPETPVETLRRAREIGLEEGLQYVYVGNIPGEENTSCHHCGRRLIRRAGHRILENHIQPDGCCPDCGTLMAGVGMAGAVL